MNTLNLKNFCVLKKAPYYTEFTSAVLFNKNGHFHAKSDAVTKAGRVAETCDCQLQRAETKKESKARLKFRRRSSL